MISTTVSVGSNPNPATYGGQVTFSAAITPGQSGGPAMTGSVTFFNGNVALGTATVFWTSGVGPAAVLCIGASLLLFLSACPAVGDGPQSKKMQDVPVLIEKLKDKDAYVRRTTLTSLGQVGSDAKVAVPAISKLLKDDSHLVRIYAAVALKKIDPKTNKALPVLLECLREKDETVRCFACIAFTDFGVEAVPGLIETFTDADANVRRWAISAVVMIGKEAIPLLNKARQDKNPQLRRYAESALKDIREFDP